MNNNAEMRLVRTVHYVTGNTSEIIINNVQGFTDSQIKQFIKEGWRLDVRENWR